MPQTPFTKNAIECRQRDAKSRGFTLVEMMVATAVLVLILVMTLQIVNYANNLFLSTRKRIDAFQEARAGFETMTRKISQAMLNTYWDYANGNVGSGTGIPKPQPGTAAYTTWVASQYTSWVATQYLRASQLHFVCGQSGSSAAGIAKTIFPSQANNLSTTPNPIVKFVGQSIFFQAPAGYSTTTTNSSLPSLMNSCGYFLEFSSDNADRPIFLQSGTETGYTSGSDPLALKFRFRLKEFNLSSEYMYAYSYASNPTLSLPSNFTLNWWFSAPIVKKSNQYSTAPLTFSPKSTLAQNVIALVIQPMRSPNYPPPVNSSGVTAPQELAPNYYYDTRSWDAPLSLGNDQWSIASRNQLPPQVQVTMVAIDEASAARLQAVNGSTVPTFSDSSSTTPALPGGLYASNGVAQLFTQVSKNTPGDEVLYQQDLSNLEKALINLHITYRVFSTNVSILQAKFSD